MEGPLLVLKSWMLTAVAIWIYQRWFQRVAPRDVAFEAFCAGRPVVGAIAGAGLHQASVLVALSSALGKPRACVATLGGYPWPHYRLELALEESRGAVLLRVIKAEVLRTRERELPALASLLRGVLNGLPEDAKVSAWLHRGAFNNGLVDSPPGGWSIERGSERRPKLVALREAPLLGAQLAQSEPELARTVTAAPHFAFENQTPRLAP